MSKASILVIDDDPALCTLIQALFTREGLHVDTARDGELGLPLILDGRHEVILLDLMVPRFSGIDVVRCLRGSVPEILPRIIVLTAASPRNIDVLPELHEVCAVVRKPFDIAELSTLVLSCIARGQARVGVTWSDASTKVQAQLQSASAEIGAVAGIVAAVSPRAEVELLWSYGYPDDVQEPFRRLPLGAPYPICDSIRSGEPIWVSSIEEARTRYPDVADIMRRTGTESLAAAPAIRHGEVVGAVGWSFRTTQSFPKEQREKLLSIAASRGTCLPLFAPRA